MAVPEQHLRKQRPVIDRAYYRSPEFLARLEQSAEAAMNSPEYLAEIRQWDVTVGDGIKKSEKTP